MTKAIDGKRARHSVIEQQQKSESCDVINLDWICDADAYERIISAVGPPFNNKVDQSKLVFDLYSARTKFKTFLALDSDKGAKRRKDLFSAVAESAARFRKSILDKAGESYVARSIFSSAADFEAFEAKLNEIIKATGVLLEQNSYGAWVRLERSPKEWLAAEILPKVYESNFGRRAGISRRDPSKVDPNEPSNFRGNSPNAVGGPCPRFIHAVMSEWGLPMSKETFARAFKNVRKRDTRRKPRPSTLSRVEGW